MSITGPTPDARTDDPGRDREPRAWRDTRHAPHPPHRHPSQHRRGTTLRPARLTITIVEGCGIWIELDGDLVDGSLDQVRTRFERLAQLGFDVVVLDARELRSIDALGADLLGDFVDRVDVHGEVVIVDPDGNVLPAAERVARATITGEPPGETWWMT